MITHPFRTILGDCPADWDVAPLGKLLDLKGSQAGAWGEDAGEEPLRVIRSTNFTNDGHFDLTEVATRYFSREQAGSLRMVAGDILLERSGGSPVQPVGRVLFVETALDGYGFGNFIQRLRPDPTRIRPAFLRWTLHELHRSGMVERLQHQTTQLRNLDLRDYYLALLPVPPPEEQDAICAVLNAVDAKLRLARAALGITASLRKSNMDGPLHHLQGSLLYHLIRGKTRARHGGR